ncbi:hypothetical protein Tco_1548152 [Tanacetum coccineum]
MDPPLLRPLLTPIAQQSPPGVSWANLTCQKGLFDAVSVGTIYKMPRTLSPNVTLQRKEKFRNVMKCLKIPSKFAKSLTCGASILWGRSRPHE